MAKKITIDDLAIMVQKGFEETAKKADIDKRFDEVDKRFDRIENILLKQHSDRIEKLELEMMRLKEALVIK